MSTLSKDNTVDLSARLEALPHNYLKLRAKLKNCSRKEERMDIIELLIY